MPFLDGMIAFPAAPPFIAGATSLIGFDGASVGVSMFFVTTVVAQLVYTLGGSGFAGANGSMMIEVVPFFHIIGMSISNAIGFETEEQQRTVIATTMASYILSSLLTGITFFLLGALRLGTVIGFFPRHILVGLVPLVIVSGLMADCVVDVSAVWDCSSSKLGMQLDPFLHVSFYPC